MAQAAVKESPKASLGKKREKDPDSLGSRAFAYAQQIGKSLFLPIAILPFAGILLGIGIDSVYINGVCVLDGDNINAEALKTTGHAVKC